MKTGLFRLIAALTPALLLAGCATNAGNNAVTDAAKDKSGYLTKNFMSKSLPAELLTVLDKDGAATLPFSSLTIKSSTSNTDSVKNQTRNMSQTYLLQNGGEGLVSAYREDENNGIPYAASVFSRFAGVITFKLTSLNYSTGRCHPVHRAVESHQTGYGHGASCRED